MKILLNIEFGANEYTKLISKIQGRTVRYPIINQDAEDIWYWYVDNADLTTNDYNILDCGYRIDGEFIYHFISDDEEIIFLKSGDEFFNSPKSQSFKCTNFLYG